MTKQATEEKTLAWHAEHYDPTTSRKLSRLLISQLKGASDLEVFQVLTGFNGFALNDNDACVIFQDEADHVNWAVLKDSYDKWWEAED